MSRTVASALLYPGGLPARYPRHTYLQSGGCQCWRVMEAIIKWREYYVVVGLGGVATEDTHARYYP